MAGSFRRVSAATAWLAVGVLAGCDRAPTEPRAEVPAVVQLSVEGQRTAVPYVPGEVIVRFKEGVDHAALELEYGLTHSEDMLLERAEVVTVAPGAELVTVASLAADERVEFAEANYLTVMDPCGDACITPQVDALAAYVGTNDTYRGYKWDLDNDGATRVGNKSAILAATPKADADIDWMEMYEHLGSSFAGSAIIGIIDTGIRDTHQDLAGRVIGARNFATGYPATDIVDKNGHGTHVAGIAAARGNNALGVIGVAYGANIKLINAKACEWYDFRMPGDTVPDIRTSCPTSSTANAIVWATDNGANVLNLSLGGSPTAATGSATQRAALQYARSKNVLPFCATGNDSYALNISFPARFPECVAVGSTDWGDKRASYSNQGAEVDLSAPGGTGADAVYASSRILSAYYRSDADYVFLTGTSMATPQAVGLAAMLYATGMTDDDAVLARLKATADDLGPAGTDSAFGAGRINAYRAITGNDAPLPPTANVGGPYTLDEGQTLALSGTATPGAGGSLTAFRWQFGASSTASAATASTSRSYPQSGSFGLFFTATESNGQTGSAGTTVTVRNVAPTVTATLDAPGIISGETARVVGSFTDPANDAPWKRSLVWTGGGPTVADSTMTQTNTLVSTHRYCAAGSYTATFTVTDKDAGKGSAVATLTVARRTLAISGPASVGSSSIGQLPVTLLGSADFLVSTVNLATVTLGNGSGTETPISGRNSGTLMTEAGDVNLDGYPDVTMYFSRASLNGTGDLPASGLATLVLRGVLADGCVQVQATAPIRVVPDIKR